MQTIKRILIGICLVVQFITASHAEETTLRTYRLPGHGVLELPVPKSWKDMVRQPSDNLPPTISLRPSKGDEFSILITPLWNMGDIKDFNSDAKIKELIERNMHAMASGAMEKKLELKSLKGSEAAGYYFMATDKAPKPGEWRFVIRSSVATGNLILSITLLSHEKESESINDALKMFRDLRQRM